MQSKCIKMKKTFFKVSFKLSKAFLLKSYVVFQTDIKIHSTLHPKYQAFQ